MSDKIVVPKPEKEHLMEYFWAVRKIPLFQRLDKIAGIALLSVIIMRNTNILTSEYWNFLLGFSGLIFFVQWLLRWEQVTRLLQADDEKFLLSKEGFLMREGMRTWKNKRLLVRKDYATIVSETSIYFAFSVRDMSDEQLQQLIQWVSEGKQQWKSK